MQTIPTERFFNPVLGSEVRESLFDFVDYGTASVIQQQIEITLENFEPRIDNVSVEAFPRPDLNEFEVTVFFNIVGQQVPAQEFTFILEATRDMPFTKFTNLDFDQIKSSIKDYIRANSNFTDFDFE